MKKNTQETAAPQTKKRTKLFRSFSRDEKASIAHALNHLLANKIAAQDCFHSGWYSGNREQFVTRHKKSIALIGTLISSTGRRKERAA